MPKIIIYRNSKPYSEIIFSNMLTIGRDKNNDLVLDSTAVSNFHASIIQDADSKFILCDQSSQNFIRVGGERIQQYLLTHGITFQIAEFLLTFFDDGNSESTEPLVHISHRIPIKELITQETKTFFTISEGIIATPKAYSDPQMRLSLLLSLTEEINSILDYHELMEKALDISIKLMAAERGFIALKNQEGQLVYSGIRGFDTESGKLRVSSTMIQKVIKEGQSILTSNAVKEDIYRKTKSVLTYQLKSVLCVPLKVRDDILGCIYLDNPEKTGNFTSHDLEFLTILAHQIAIAIENAKLHKRVLDERTSLKSRLRMSRNIIVKSEKMVSLYKDVQKVARSNVAVLILGETGTGKELVARAIHDFSGRQGQFIELNCSAIPENLLESELFGYEKGAFTDAQSPKPGMFEVAKGGTIFLDEIGEMSLFLQPKLLKVLQEKKVSRLGGIKSTMVDVRVVAATNRDLKAMMKNKQFRQDLYYRLAGVELKVHPLRERKEDIPSLANYFLLKFSEENDLRTARISHKAMQMLIAYDWPGNINELKNVIGCASLFGNGLVIQPEDLPEELQRFDKETFEDFSTIEDIERQHIKKALQRSNGNKKLAAQLLGITRDTLYKKIEKYTIY